MFTVTLGGNGRRWSVLTASTLVTAAGGGMDAWVYLAHGGVFANAQTGNVALMAIALADGQIARAMTHLPSLLAFVIGMLASRLSGESLKRRHLNSRNLRLALECVMLVALGLFAYRMSNYAVTACVGFLAGVQITTLSHIGPWSLNTGMTTGNLRAGISALSKALRGCAEEWPHAAIMFTLCVAFAAGAVGGAWLTPRLGGGTLAVIAALIAAAITVAPWRLDPIPGWSYLK